MPPREMEFAALAAYIAQRRGAILQAWRKAVTADPTLTSGASLPRSQLHDHIPALLVDFEQRLAAGRAAGAADVVDAKKVQKGDAAAHGLHRWQQGFDLAEVRVSPQRFDVLRGHHRVCEVGPGPSRSAAPARRSGARITTADHNTVRTPHGLRELVTGRALIGRALSAQR